MSILILIAVGTLFSRSFNWGGFCTRNVVLVTFLLYALVSFVWSDFCFITRPQAVVSGPGQLLRHPVVLSDPHPLEAVRSLLRRLAYLLIPLSILLNKYYPNMSKQYDPWTGAAMFVGTAGRNILSIMCLISGIFFQYGDTLWADLQGTVHRTDPPSECGIHGNDGLVALFQQRHFQCLFGDRLPCDCCNS